VSYLIVNVINLKNPRNHGLWVERDHADFESVCVSIPAISGCCPGIAGSAVA